MSSSGEKRTAVVLLWTFNHEPEFYDKLDQQFSDWVVVPLRYRALSQARSVLPPGRVRGFNEIVTAAMRAEFYLKAIQRYNVFWSRMLAVKDEPWLTCIQGYQVTPLFYAVELWALLLKALRSGSGAQIFHIRPFSTYFLNGKVLKDIDLLDAFCTPPLKSGLVQQLRCMLDSACGSICNHWAEFVTRPFSPQEGPQVDTLICGLQSTDWISQAGYVQELKKAGHGNFRWMIPAHDRLAKTEDEKMGLAGIESVRDKTETFALNEFGYLEKPEWKNIRMAEWSDIQVLKRVRAAVCEAFPEIPFKAVLETLSVAIVRMHAGLRLNYEGIDRLLSQRKPKQIVASQTMEQLSYLRAWSRKNGIPYLRFPHGVELHLDAEHFWNADRVGALGTFARDRLEKLGSVSGEVTLCGGMHLAQQGQYTARRMKEGRLTQTSTPRRALFLMGGYWAFSMPDAPDEIRMDLMSLSQALKQHNIRLSVRCHPRHLDAESFRLIVTELASQGLDIDWSDARKSLTEDLLASGSAISSTWNGSALMCLYGDIPLVGWIPRPLYAETEAALRNWPLTASTSAETVDLISRSIDDPGFRSQSLTRQCECLKSFIYNPWGDPYSEAVAAYAKFCSADPT